MTGNDMLASIEAGALVAIVRGHFQPEHVLEIGHALVRGGISAIEVTLNSDHALEAISLLKQHLGARALIGAGTVVAPDQVDEAVAAGARYLIAPGLDSACVERAQRRGIPFIPGVFTATEIGRALAHECQLLKLFPALEVRPQYLAAMRGPFPQARFMVTGGIGLAEIEKYHLAGATAFGMGSSLVKHGRPPEEIEALAGQLVKEVARARAAVVGRDS